MTTRGITSILKLFRSPAGCVEVPEYEKIGYRADLRLEDAGKDTDDKPPAPDTGVEEEDVPPPPPDTGVEEEDVPPPPRCSQEQLSCEPGQAYYRLDSDRRNFDINYRVRGAEWFGCSTPSFNQQIENPDSEQMVSRPVQLNQNYCEGEHSILSNCAVSCGDFSENCSDVSFRINSPPPFDIELAPSHNTGVFPRNFLYRFAIEDRRNKAEVCEYYLEKNGEGLSRPQVHLRNGVFDYEFGGREDFDDFVFSHFLLRVLNCEDAVQCEQEVNQETRFFTLEEGIVHYWSFGFQEGNTVFDYADGSHDGEIRGNPLPFSEGPLSSRILDGDGDYVTTTEPAMLGIADTWTISFWVYRTALDSDVLFAIGNNVGVNAYKDFIHLNVNNDGIVGLTYYDHAGNMGQMHFVNGGDPQRHPLHGIGNWRHVVLAKRPGVGSDKIALYVNGSGFGQSNVSGYFGVQSDLPRQIRFGEGLENSSIFLNGKIAEISIYNRRLETPEHRRICRLKDPAPPQNPTCPAP